MTRAVDRAPSPELAPLLKSYPRRRPPLSPAHQKVYAEQYRLNREGAGAIENVAQRLERWMHRRVASMQGGPVLELGAGTLNHRRYEDPSIAYDVVEPFRELYAGKPEAQSVRAFYDSVADIPADRRYARVISIAVLEHMENLPADIANAALLLDERGVFQAGIPSEGGFLWGAPHRRSLRSFGICSPTCGCAAFRCRGITRAFTPTSTRAVPIACAADPFSARANARSEVQMRLADFALLLVYALGMSIGQVLFKLAAEHAKLDEAAGFWAGLFGSWHFYVSVAIYGLLTVVWIWVLTRIPLSRAYPFVVLAFVFTPILAAVFFGETLDARYYASLALIVGGLGLLASGNAQ